MQLSNLVSSKLLAPILHDVGTVDGWRDHNSPLFNPVKESGEPLVDIAASAPTILGKPAYHLSAQYVRKSVADMLSAAQTLLPADFQLVLFDGWRSLTTQQELYLAEYARHNDHLKTQKYVSLPSDDPTVPSPHNTGGAVDVALFYKGEMLDFGTPFDHMAPESHLVYYEQLGADTEARDARRLLYAIMTQVGFLPYYAEWWHFNYGNQMAIMAQYHATGERAPAIYGSSIPNMLK